MKKPPQKEVVFLWGAGEPRLPEGASTIFEKNGELASPKKIYGISKSKKIRI